MSAPRSVAPEAAPEAPFDLVSHVDVHLRAWAPPGAHLLLGLSGGIDSVALLAVLAGLSASGRFSLRALHVNHGISPNAADWSRFCAGLCEAMGIPLSVETVDLAPLRHLGLEAAARVARYAAFGRHPGDFLVLAQHRDDQAETVLLQLLRGAGLPGVSGMAAVMPQGAGPAHLAVLRPLLDVPRRDIAAFARGRGFAWIEDESNGDIRRDRNFIRHRVLPEIEQRFGAARKVIARSARHFAQAAILLDELGRNDLDSARHADGWRVDSLRALGPARAKNALRALCRAQGVASPAEPRLEELWRQLRRAREDASMRIDIDARMFHRYRGTLYVQARQSEPVANWSALWEGEPKLALPELGGVLLFKAEEGRGLSVEKLRQAPVTVRLRCGGEVFRPDAKRPRRTLKNLMQERGIPPWKRRGLPLVYCGEHLVCVPEIGEDAEWRAQAGEAGLIVSWESL